MHHVPRAGIAQLRVDELRSFLVLAEELHFARAAARLHITPGGLTRRLNHVERLLGVQLVRRTTRSADLTDAGLRFRQVAGRVLDELSVLDDLAHPSIPGEAPRLLAG